MAYPIESEAFPTLWRQQNDSTFQKQKTREAAIEARIAAQKQARLAAQASHAEMQYDGELVRNARIAGRYGD